MDPSSGCFKSTRPASFFSDNLPQLSALIEMIDSATSKVTVDAPMKSVVIGAVPDRGGHAHKQRPSARDMMPAWQQRTEGGGKGGKGRGGGRGRGGGGGKGRGGGRGKGKRK